MRILTCNFEFISLDNFIAGWMGGVTGLLVGHPLDTIKVRQQIYGSSLSETVQKTLKQEGFIGFYKGLLFPLVSVGISNAVFFGVYGNVMQILEKDKERNRTVRESAIEVYKKQVIAGSVAAFVQVLITCPIDVVKTVLQSDTNPTNAIKNNKGIYKGPVDAFIKMFKKKGFPGIYRGITPMLIRDVPTGGLYVGMYEELMYFTFGNWDVHDLIKQIIAGGIAGIFAFLPVIPADVVKSRLQADDIANPKYKGTMDCMSKVLAENGVKALYQGTPVLIMRAFITNGAIFVGFETTLFLLQYLNI